MRPRQWVKNGVVLLAPFAAGVLAEFSDLVRVLGAAVLLCLLSGGLYICNDVADRHDDRLDPRTANRPVAAGRLAPRDALAIGMVLAFSSVLVGALLLGFVFALTLGSYASLTTLYSTRLKRIPYLELLVVGSGFLLRVLAGATAADVPVSSAFLVAVWAGAAFLAAAKRTGELRHGQSQRVVLRTYTPATLTIVRVLMVVIVAGAFSAWAALEGLVWWSSGTTLLTVIALVRAEGIARRGLLTQPELTLLKDPVLLTAALTWLLLFGMGTYAF